MLPPPYLTDDDEDQWEDEDTQDALPVSKYSVVDGTAIQRRNVKATVDDLRNDVADINQYFDQLHRAIKHLESNRPKAPGALRAKTRSVFGGSPIPEPLKAGCTNDWETIVKEFRTAVQESKELATKMATHAKSFRLTVVVLLHDKARSFQQNERMLATFIRQMETDISLANEVSKRFANIPRSIDMFQDTYWTGISCAMEADKANSERLKEELNTKIKKLDAKLKKYSAKHAAACSSFNDNLNTYEDVKAAIRRAFEAFLGPVGGIGFPYEDPSDVKKQPTMSKQRVKVQATTFSLTDRREELKKLKEKIASVTPGYVLIAQGHSKVICERLEAIAKVWSAVKVDASMLKMELESSLEQGEEYFEAHLEEREDILPTYAMLEGLLIDYSSQIE